MIAAALLIASLAGTIIPPAFDIQVAPVAAIRQGDPIQLHATLTYRGERPICIDYFNYSRSCVYYLPKQWNAIVRKQSAMFTHVGWSEIWIRKGDAIHQIIDITRDYEITSDRGDYEIEIQGRLSDASVPRGQSPILRSPPIKVPITILVRGPGK